MSNPKYLDRTRINYYTSPAVVLEFILYVFFGIKNILRAGGKTACCRCVVVLLVVPIIKSFIVYTTREGQKLGEKKYNDRPFRY